MHNKVGAYFQIHVPNQNFTILNVDFDALDSVINCKTKFQLKYADMNSADELRCSNSAGQSKNFITCESYEVTQSFSL